jgi:hypothetical protein
MNVRLRAAELSTIPLEQGVRYLMADLVNHVDGLGAAALTPEVDWKTGAMSTAVAGA